MALAEWKALFELSDRHGFLIASDECYSELYYGEPCLGALQAAHRLGREGYPRLVVFSSLSKRSNAPGMRSGFVAGDAGALRSFLLYRTYHGSAMRLPALRAARRMRRVRCARPSSASSPASTPGASGWPRSRAASGSRTSG